MGQVPRANGAARADLPRFPLAVAVLTFAAVKGRRIASDYLDLRSAPPLWLGLATAWLLLVLGFAWAVSAASFFLR